MPLALEAAQTTLLDTLQDDIKTAWAPTRIFRDPPELVKTNAQLPVAFLFLSEALPDPERSALPCNVGAAHSITCALRFARPSTGIVETKRAKAEALRALVTTGRLYTGLSRRWDGDEYLSPNPDEVDREASQSAFVTVRVRFTFWIDTDGA